MLLTLCHREDIFKMTFSKTFEKNFWLLYVLLSIPIFLIAPKTSLSSDRQCCLCERSHTAVCAEMSINTDGRKQQQQNLVYCYQLSATEAIHKPTAQISGGRNRSHKLSDLDLGD